MEKKTLVVFLIGALAGIGGLTAYRVIVHHSGGWHENETIALSLAKLDSSSKWVCHVGGACAGGKGICCASGLESHVAGIENIESVEVDREKGLMTLTIKKGREVKTAALQKAFGSHWRIKDVKPEEAI